MRRFNWSIMESSDVSCGEGAAEMKVFDLIRRVTFGDLIAFIIITFRELLIALIFMDNWGFDYCS